MLKTILQIYVSVGFKKFSRRKQIIETDLLYCFIGIHVNPLSDKVFHSGATLF